ncbi:MAG: hypothetical protein PHY93_13915 [Bacteriovorax sp.]|nr:hypothetical protein [Bacteriovorax sp.]
MDLQLAIKELSYFSWEIEDLRKQGTTTYTAGYPKILLSEDHSCLSKCGIL